ncbi:MAG: hypothetical protein JNM12_11040 [Alphaproteobacteria bacterium]|nr:hypothetical protein [Alphaproteobacteria bacterium]
MGKFKIKMKLQGLELEIEGSREDVPLISENLGRQMAGLLQPAGAIVEGEVSSKQIDLFPQTTDTVITKRSRRRKTGTSTVGTSPSEGVATGAIDWRHDPSKFGVPSQTWNTSDKSVWLLYVIAEAAEQKELSAGRIAKTFEKHFRQAGVLKPSNVSRDLGKLKLATPALTGEDTTKDPSLWYLTDAGRKHAQQLIAKSISEVA